MRADYMELPQAGIVERDELEKRRYRGFNPAFARRVWAKRRQEESRPSKPEKPERWPQSVLDQVAVMLESGLSSGQIARKLGRTPNSIIGIVRHDTTLRAIGFQTIHARKTRERLLAGGTTP